MSQPDDPPLPVGRQLAERREELDLTQESAARRIGVTATTVSATERNRNEISRSKRPAWEQALRLKPGTITKAYRTGSAIEPLNDEDQLPADMSDPHERAIWEMDISEDDRRTMIEILRTDRRDRHSA